MAGAPQPPFGASLHVPPREIKRLRIGHRHAFYSLRCRADQLILIACVAQDSVKPCTWAVSYTAQMGENPVDIKRISFDSNSLRRFREAYANRSLSWLDTAFMLRLSLDRAVRDLVSRDAVPIQIPQSLMLSDLHILRVNGGLPHIDHLLDVCQEHVLLHRDLTEVKDLPPLIVS